VKGSTYISANGVDLFEFSIDGIIKQHVRKQRVSNYYVEKGQIVSVRTRYAVNFDGK
jgi:hypothetical protein